MRHLIDAIITCRRLGKGVPKTRNCVWAPEEDLEWIEYKSARDFIHKYELVDKLLQKLRLI